MPGPRWEGDKREMGIATGTAFADELTALSATMLEAGWVAEDPDLHLLPHLRRFTRQPSSPWTIEQTHLRPDGVFVLDLSWLRTTAPLRQLHADFYALIGEIAESAGYIRQAIRETTIEYRVVTGMLAADTRFAPHGHLLLFRIHGERVFQFLNAIKAGPPATHAS
jgi:hypothetical protein